MSGMEKEDRKYGAGQRDVPQAKIFEFRPSQFIAALALMAAGAVGIGTLASTNLVVGGKNLTSIGLLVAGLVFYTGVLFIVAMFRNETYLSIAILLPSIVAVAVFVYGFIGWSVR